MVLIQSLVCIEPDTTMVLTMLFSGQSYFSPLNVLERGVTAGPCNSFLCMQPKLRLNSKVF